MEDHLYKFLALYNHFPQFLKQFVGFVYNILPRKLRYGSFYVTYLQRLEYFNNMKDIEEVKQKQAEILIDQVNYAIENVSFYKNYQKISSLDEFANFPIIDKKTIVTYFDSLSNPKLATKRILTNTGGSSGTPMEFFIEKGISRSKEKAHFDWFWGQFGYKPNDRILMIRGLPLRNNKSFEFNAIDNILKISCYNINEQNISVICEKINKFKPSYIHAYPSSLKVVTSLLDNYDQQLSISLKAIFLGSEHLICDDREYFERFYKTKVVSWYGHTERLVHGGNCLYSNEFHFYPCYGYVELVDDNNVIITESGREGKIVTTGFDNKAMPFIRYNTGDIGILSEMTECKCGFKGVSLSKIVGRDQDVIVLSDNTKVSLTAFIFGQHLHAFSKIREMQLVQEEIGQIVLKIVKNSNFDDNDETSIIKTLLKSVDNKLKISISYVEEIPKTPRGKNIFFQSHLK